jgi:hypothetical protein
MTTDGPDVPEFDFAYDPPQQPPEPDREVLAIARNRMLADESPTERYVRQQWEVTFSAVKVAMDAWRHAYPEFIMELLPPDEQPLPQQVMGDLEALYQTLDAMTASLNTEEVHLAECGNLNREEQERIYDQA